ncbi:olfactory receptor 10A7-like [Pseudophryne corroboree]|uniref:olfactory receptor 10A7-like n=1 Tax=Pseudophryne corroboree TaxID=495146 RepID=UPI00308187E3
MHNPKPWVLIELSFLDLKDMRDLFLLPAHSVPKWQGPGEAVRCTLKLWQAAVASDSTVSLPSANLHIGTIARIIPNLVLDAWMDAGIVHLRDLCSEGGLVPFSGLQSHSGISKQDFFKYLQIRHWLQSCAGESVGPVPLPASLRIRLSSPEHWGGISKWYQYIILLSKQDPKEPKTSPTEPPEQEVEGEEHPKGTFYHQAEPPLLYEIKYKISILFHITVVVLETNLSQGSNQTMVTSFILLGFQGSINIRMLLFISFLVIYCMTICGNLLIITLVSYDRNLHSPMYFFLTQLSMSDIIIATDVVPYMLHILSNGQGNISFIGCITQLYVFCASGSSDCLILTVMAYDRYLAICKPLHYVSIMNRGHCMKLAILCWTLSFSIVLIDSITTAMLQFCGPNIIDHFFCDLVPLQELSCSDTTIVQLEVSLLSAPLLLIPCIIIIASYINILFTVLTTSSNTVRQKAFSTCTSHLTVVSIFFWTLFSVYGLPAKGQSLSISKIVSLIYTVMTPLLNPIIYSLRNKDIKKALQKTLLKNVFS